MILLQDFLKKYQSISNAFISDFFSLYTTETTENDIVINFTAGTILNDTEVLFKIVPAVKCTIINKLDIFFALGIYPKQKTIYKNFKNTTYFI